MTMLLVRGISRPNAVSSLVHSAAFITMDRVTKKCRVARSRSFAISAAIVEQKEGSSSSSSRTSRRMRRREEEFVEEFPEAAQPQQPQQQSHDGAKPKDKSHLSESRFDQFGMDKLTIKAIKDVLGYETMTKVQEATLPLILKGEDVLAKAKTGTGKTIAFLLPTIEQIIKLEGAKAATHHENPIRALIICPTRELAMQAATEAQTLLKFHKELGAQTAIGGNSSVMEAKKLKFQACQILVGTPGRLLDHIKNAKGFTDQLRCLKVLVLDEADTLLDMGFRQNLTDILKALPKKRQTLLFSATIPKEVHNISQLALKPEHKFVDTVGEDTETHAVVKQKYIITQQDAQFATLYTLLKQHMEEDPNYKVLVFCITANITAYMAALYQKLGFNVREIHSRKTQTSRVRVSEEFRKSKGGIIMFTSDVSARGIDYPDVTLVIQIGVPAGRDQYIHRLGRTGRAGKDGQGILMLLPWEESFLRKLNDISVDKMEAPKVLELIQKMKPHIVEIENGTRVKAYQSWLGYYTTAKSLSVDKHSVVEYSRKYVYCLGYSSPPPLQKLTLKKMGLAGLLD